MLRLHDTEFFRNLIWEKMKNSMICNIDLIEAFGYKIIISTFSALILSFLGTF